MKRYIINIILISIISGLHAFTDQSNLIEIPMGLEEIVTTNHTFVPYHKIKRVKIALALSGGGARGLAQIGVLKSLERNSIHIDGIAGTSMGAIVGALLAMGYNPNEIEKISYNIEWEKILHDAPSRSQLFLGQKEEKSHYIFQLRFKKLHPDLPSAYTKGYKLKSLLTELILKAPCPYQTDFDKLTIPLRVVTTDLVTGKKIVFKRGSLIDVLHASMVIPLLFEPVTIGSYQLVDGGLVQNLPVTEARSMDADIVIGVDTSSKLRKPESMQAPWEIADQVTTIMQKDITQAQLDSADVAVQPRLSGISNTDFSMIKSLIEAGERAAEEVIPQIKRLIKERTYSRDTTRYKIHKISIYGLRSIPSSHLFSIIKLDTTAPLSVEQIVNAGHALLKSGYFSSIKTFIDTTQNHLIFKVEENPLIREIVFSGNTVFSDSTLLDSIETRAGEITNIQKGIRDIKKIVEMYQRAGYSLARVDTAGIDQNGVLTIVIDEGRIGKITIYGNHHTQNFIVSRNLHLKPGDLFNAELLKKGIDQIYSSGYFDLVWFSVKKNGFTYNLNIYLDEHGYTLLRTGLRYDLERSTKGFLQIVGENLFGTGNKGAFTALIGRKDILAGARIWSDRLFTSLLSYRMETSIHKHTYSYYSDHKKIGNYTKCVSEASVSLGQQMRRLGTVSLQLKTESIRVNPDSAILKLKQKYNLRTITLRSEVDSRDRYPFPIRGKYHILQYETAGKYIGSEISYTKIYSSMESFYPLSKVFNFHPRLAWGTSDSPTPFVKQFRIGGIDSFMGLPEEALIGRRFICFNGELRLRIPFPRWLEYYISIRYDFGGVWSSYSKISMRDFKHGIGVKLSFNTPVGPLCIAYGNMSDGVSQFYFSFGRPF